MSNSRSLQRRLMHDITLMIESRQLNMKYLQDLLNIKKTALYSRINGKKLLDIRELQLLSDAFDLDLNTYFKPDSKHIMMRLPSLEQEITSPKQYLRQILDGLTRISKLQNPEIFYISSEIPLFNYFRYPELAMFKLHVYGKTVWEVPDLKNKQFIISVEERKDFERTFQQIDYLYNNLPSNEIWSSHLVDSTLNQIKHYTQSGLFDNTDTAITLLRQLSSLVNDIEVAAEKGYKRLKDGQQGAAFHLFHNEITQTNNVFLVNSLSAKLAFSTYDNPNYFESDDGSFWRYSIIHFNNLKKRSHSITNQSEQNRLEIFKVSRDNIMNVRQCASSLN